MTKLHPGVALRLALRGVRGDLATALATALTLALGIGASTTLFALVSGSTRDLPVPQGHEIVRIDLVSRESGTAPIDGAVLSGWQEASRTLVAIGTARPFAAVLTGEHGYAERVAAAALSPEVLPMLRVEPAFGRFPSRAEPALVIGWELWQERFGGDPAAVGAEVQLDGESRTIVGIMPPHFGFPTFEKLWVPDVEADVAGAEVVGRLAPGSSPAQAAAELDSLRRSLADAAATTSDARVRVRGFTAERGEGDEAVAFAALGSIVLALLIVASVNGSTLLLLRAARRGQVIGVQRALGAGRAQVGLQLLLEAAIVAAAGGLGGLVLTWLAMRWADRVLSVHFGYHWMRMAVDAPVLGANLTLVMLAAILAGALPAWRAMHADPAEVLRGGVRARGVGRAGSIFLSLQVGGATAALAGGMLLASGLAGWGSWKGMLPDQPIVFGTIDFRGTEHAIPGAAAAWRARWLEEVAPLPAALAVAVPGFGERRDEIELQFGSEPEVVTTPRMSWNAVSPGYFELFAVPTASGRTIEASDVLGAPPVAVVNTAFVARYLNGRSPLQTRLRIDGGEWVSVVGVVEGRESDGLQPAARVYLSLAQSSSLTTTLLVGGGSDPAMAATRLRDAVRRLAPELPTDNVRTLLDFYIYLTRLPRTIATVGIGGAIAGLLTMLIGLYGLLAFDVRQRTFEIGVRMAIGADGHAVAAGVLRRAAALLVPGVVGGLALMYLLAPLFGLFLFRTDPRAPLPFVLVGVTTIAVGLLAALVPAARAVRVQPATVLRSQ